MKLPKLKKRLYIYILLFTALLFSEKFNAQVTVGSNVPSNKGALLDLKEDGNLQENAKKGLLLPRVNLQAVNILPPENGTFTEKDIHVGLTVYNLKNNTGYATRNDPDMLCEGPYVWDGDKWVRLWKKCMCEYQIIGWGDGKTYNILCDDFENITQEQAINTCKGAANDKYSYHLMTYEEYQQIWSQPVSVDAVPTTDYGFSSGIDYFVHKKSSITPALGWVTVGFQSGTSSGDTREVLAWDKLGYQVTATTSKYFPGGTPIGGELSRNLVRCIRD